MSATGDGRRTGELLRLAWPAMLSYFLNNAYRINDQYWIQGLGAEAQTAIGTTFFVQVMNFALVFLAVGGTLALVARARGANDPVKRDSLTRHALLFGVALGTLLALVVVPLVRPILALLGLAGASLELGTQYLGTVYLFMTPMALFPVVDAIFIARGNSRVPMALQSLAVAMNYFLNPFLIYGQSAGEAVSAPGASLVAALAAPLGFDGLGMTGAGLATGIARTTTVLIGLWLLSRGMGFTLFRRGWPRWARIGQIARVSAPVSVSIGVYALAYFGLMSFVLHRLDGPTVAGLGIGFQVFEGVAFPCYLGVSIAASSLVGRELGARDRAGALEVVRLARKAARVLGLAFMALFWFGGAALVPFFTQDAAVARETLLYVQVLAFSQYWVAVETVNEKVLLGAGFTRPILWISPLGNLLRVPLGALFALGLGFGAAGVWWAVNASTFLKAFLYWRRVEDHGWLERGLSDANVEINETNEAPPAPRAGGVTGAAARSYRSPERD